MDLYAGYAEDYDDGYHGPLVQHEDTWMLRWMHQNGLFDSAYLLDVGCGTGWLLDHVPLAETGYHGIDVSPAMIEVARHKYPRHSFEVRDMLSVYPDWQFDAAVSLFALNYCKAPRAAIQRIMRALRPRAPLALVVYAPGRLRDHDPGKLVGAEHLAQYAPPYTWEQFADLLHPYVIRHLSSFSGALARRFPSLYNLDLVYLNKIDPDNGSYFMGIIENA